MLTKLFDHRLYISLILLCFISTTLHANQITESEVLKAQKAWAEGMQSISKMKAKKQASAAKKWVLSLYAFPKHPVLFKPTTQNKIILTQKDTIDYFTPKNKLKINRITFKNADIIYLQDSAIAMGQYRFEIEGIKDPYLFDYTFVYIKDNKGALKIIAHHSSTLFKGL